MALLNITVNKDIIVGWDRSRCSDALRDGRSGDRIPLGCGIFPTRPGRPWGPPSLLYKWYRVSFLGLKRSARGSGYPPSSSAEVKERRVL